MRRIRKYLAYALLVIAVAGVLLTAAAGYLLGTASGAGRLLSWVGPALPGELEFDDVDGAVLRTLTVTGIRWRQDGVRAEVDRLSVDASLWPLVAKGLVDVEAFEADGVRVYLPASEPPVDPGPPAIPVPEMTGFTLPVGVVIGAARVTAVELHRAAGSAAPATVQRIERVELAGSAFRQDIELERLVVRAPAWEVDARGRATLGPRLPIDLTADWRTVDGGGAETAAGALRLAGNRQSYDVEHTLRLPHDVSTTGTIRPGTEDTVFALITRVPSASLAVAGRTLETRGAKLELTGRLSDWQADLDGEFTVAETGPVTVSMAAAGDLASARIANAAVERVAGGSVRLAGDIGYGDGLTWDVSFDADAVPLELAAPTLQGTVSAAGESAGTLRPTLSVEVSMSSLQGRLRDRVIRGQAAVAYQNGTLRIARSELAIGDNVVRIDGQIGDALALTLAADAPALSDLYPGLSGGIEADAVLSGTLKAPGLRGSLSGRELGWRDLATAALTIEAEVDAGEGTVSVGVRDLVAAGRDIESAAVRAVGSIERHTIRVTGTSDVLANVDASLRGGWREQAWRGEVLSLAATLPPLGERDAVRLATTDSAALIAGPAETRLEELCFAADTAPGRGGDASLCLRADVRGADVDAAYRAADIPLAWLPLQLPSGGRLQGALDSGGEVTLDAAGLAAVFDVSVTDASAVFFADSEQQEVIPIEELAADGRIESGTLTAGANVRFSDEATLDARVSVGMAADDGTIDGELTVRVDDVSRIDPLLPGVDILAGRLNGELTLGGTRAQPAAEGEATLTDGRVRVPDLGITLKSLELSVASGAGGALRYAGTALSGDGTLRIDGETSLRPENRLDTRLAVTGERVLLVNLPDMRALADANLDVTLTQGRYAVAGNVTIPEANVTVRQLPESAVEVSGDAIVHRGGRPAPDERDPGSRLVGTIDIEATLGERVQLSGFGLDTRLTGGLTLRQAIRGPILGSGQLRLRDATYEAYGQKLDVERGILTFNGPLNAPFLDVRAARTVDSAEVGIDITGTPDRLQSSLYSDPALPQAEILSLLLTGRSLNQASASEGSLLSNAALGLGLKQAGNVAASIGQTVGLDKLAIDGGAGDGRLIAGKNLSENLYVQYAYGLFDQVSNVLLRLKLSNRLSLETNSGESQSVDLIYEVGNIRL